MVTMKTTGLALTLAGVAAAQSQSVISVFFPGADSQTLLGSVIKSVGIATGSLNVPGC